MELGAPGNSFAAHASGDARGSEAGDAGWRLQESSGEKSASSEAAGGRTGEKGEDEDSITRSVAVDEDSDAMVWLPAVTEATSVEDKTLPRRNHRSNSVPIEREGGKEKRNSPEILMDTPTPCDPGRSPGRPRRKPSTEPGNPRERCKKTDEISTRDEKEER